MQRFSFDFGDPFFDFDGWQVAVQVTTFENTYGLASALSTVREDGTTWAVECAGLTWAGGQQSAAGRAWIRASRTSDGIEIAAGAVHSERIRSLKLTVRGHKGDTLIARNWEEGPVPARGTVLRYPLFLHTPLIFLRNGARFAYFRALDGRVRAKRLAVYPELDGTITVELIHEGAAHEMTGSMETPPWRVGITADPETAVREQIAHVEAAFGLRPWEERPDVPDWAREISLVVAIHGIHWTGYVFNTYAQMLDALRWVCERIEGRRVLAFLPGWEGRYYWQYGDYRPEPLLGGADGFRALCDGAKGLGVTLMPMFGANCANAGAPGFERWGEPSVLKSPTGMVFQGNRPDWDASRSNDPGWQAWLNPGAPLWREHLLGQVSELLRDFGLRAVFFDTHHIWENDPDYPLYEGLIAIRDELHNRFTDLLIAGEGWYDALGAITPVSQEGAPEQWPDIFARYNRTFGHLMSGDPSRGSSGVHEAGYTPFRPVPRAAHWWPTLTIVDGTLEGGREGADLVIAQAREYALEYLG